MQDLHAVAGTSEFCAAILLLFHNATSHFPEEILQKADIMCRTLEAACWLRLGCWSNSVENTHVSNGPFNCWELLSCRVPQCSHPTFWSCHQRLFANCDWMPTSYTSGQSSYPRGHPICLASSQRSHHTVSNTPWHRARTPAPLSDHLSTE